jgi:environmental stress-induced protein Ves
MFIFPETCIYSYRNFDFKISSVTIEVESSYFTPLKVYHRLLTILDDENGLIVSNLTEVTLKQSELFWFNGSNEVKDKVMVCDFNVLFSLG